MQSRKMNKQLLDTLGLFGLKSHIQCDCNNIVRKDVCRLAMNVEKQIKQKGGSGLRFFCHFSGKESLGIWEGLTSFKPTTVAMEGTNPKPDPKGSKWSKLVQQVLKENCVSKFRLIVTLIEEDNELVCNGEAEEQKQTDFREDKITYEDKGESFIC